MTDTFDILPLSLQQRIDKAFNALATSPPSQPYHTSHVESTHHEDTGGGFLIDEPLEPTPNQIPLSSIPDALRRLDLPPDDDRILSVFRNAASGWNSATNSIDERHVSESGSLVTRDDWRSVCAVLLDCHAEELEESNEDSVYDDKMGSDDFHVSTGEGSDDEYQDVPASTAGRHRRAHRSGSPAPDSKKPLTLTKEEKEKCLEAYSLFFPSVALGDLPNQKIMIKDVQRVAAVLREELAADEVCDVLTYLTHFCGTNPVVDNRNA
ncbi:hypothetical protein AX15_003039 [Amanita polypyramis BW_CC]|nr:hypothetical protein AX15_003039 [Amanita polypyramis BW_CC]